MVSGVTQIAKYHTINTLYVFCLSLASGFARALRGNNRGDEGERSACRFPLHPSGAGM